jgi:hypothetical protein
MQSLEAGMSDEVSVLVSMEIDGTAPENVNPVTELEENEFIEVILAPYDGLHDFILRSFVAISISALLPSATSVGH